MSTSLSENSVAFTAAVVTRGLLTSKGASERLTYSIDNCQWRCSTDKVAAHQNAPSEGGIIDGASNTQVIVTKHELRQLAMYGVLITESCTYHIVEPVQGLYVTGRRKWCYIGNSIQNWSFVIGSEDLEQLRKIIKEKEDQLVMKDKTIRKEKEIGKAVQLQIHRLEQRAGRHENQLKLNGSLS
jgi:hypothetical protein